MMRSRRFMCNQPPPRGTSTPAAPVRASLRLDLLVGFLQVLLLVEQVGKPFLGHVAAEVVPPLLQLGDEQRRALDLPGPPGRVLQALSVLEDAVDLQLITLQVMLLERV